MASLFVGFTPLPLLAGDAGPSSAGAGIPSASGGLRASIVRTASAAAENVPARQAGNRTTALQLSGGGGGGKTMLVVGLVTAAAGGAATYFMIKEMRKETDRNSVP